MEFSLRSLLAVLAVCSSLVAGQLDNQPLKPQLDTWNSDFSLSKKQIASANLSKTAANNINIATRFERTNWATGSVLDDAFYSSLPANASTAPAGSILKVEASTEIGNYTLAPALALSRIVYQSATFNGSRVPVSAYVLWPFRNRNSARTAPLVSWGHGTSGIFAECAPSHVRNLWNQFSAPYQLALAGYAVVASDYAGLGVAQGPDGEKIVHQYVSSPAAANDLLYAAQAAHAAFPDRVTKEFVVVGHSQGGGAAWAAAQQQLKAKIPGYLGSVAVAPITNVVEQAKLLQSGSIGLLQTAKSFRTIFPEIALSDILTPEGIKLIELLESIQGCNSAYRELIVGALTANPSLALGQDKFLASPVGDQWGKLNAAGGKNFKGPLLVLQGTEDGAVYEQLTTKYVKQTCDRYPKNGLHYVKAKGVGHVPILYATQQIWLSWIDEQFSKAQGKYPTLGQGKCTRDTIGNDTPRPLESYNTQDLNYFLEFANAGYQVS